MGYCGAPGDGRRAFPPLDADESRRVGSQNGSGVQWALSSEKGARMNDEIEVRQLTEQPTVSIREQVARDMIHAMLAERITEIEAFIAGRRGQSTGVPFARLHNYGEVQRDDLDLEVGVPTTEAVDCPADTAFDASRLPGGPAAVLRYRGPYEEIGAAYERLQA